MNNTYKTLGVGVILCLIGTVGLAWNCFASDQAVRLLTPEEMRELGGATNDKPPCEVYVDWFGSCDDQYGGLGSGSQYSRCADIKTNANNECDGEGSCTGCSLTSATNDCDTKKSHPNALSCTLVTDRSCGTVINNPTCFWDGTKCKCGRGMATMMPCSRVYYDFPDTPCYDPDK